MAGAFRHSLLRGCLDGDARSAGGAACGVAFGASGWIIEAGRLQQAGTRQCECRAPNHPAAASARNRECDTRVSTVYLRGGARFVSEELATVARLLFDERLPRLPVSRAGTSIRIAASRGHAPRPRADGARYVH